MFFVVILFTLPQHTHILSISDEIYLMFLLPCSATCVKFHHTYTKFPFSFKISNYCLGSAPSAPPQNISVVMRGDHTIALQWSPPPETTRNGNLTSYTVYCKAASFEDVEAQSLLVPATSLNSTFDNLNPYTEYAVWISASTEAGEGPKSKVFRVTTDESSG